MSGSEDKHQQNICIYFCTSLHEQIRHITISLFSKMFSKKVLRIFADIGMSKVPKKYDNPWTLLLWVPKVHESDHCESSKTNLFKLIFEVNILEFSKPKLNGGVPLFLSGDLVCDKRDFWTSGSKRIPWDQIT